MCGKCDILKAMENVNNKKDYKYKYELHCHTGCVSRCGRVDPQEIARLYIERGYSGIVITDHYSPMTFEPNWCPQKQIDFYLDGYRRVKEAAQTIDKTFTVLLGMELRHYGTANDYLVYGVDEEFLYTAGNLMKIWEKKAYELCSKSGYLVFQAHPFRPAIRRCNPDCIDGIEVYNGKTDKNANDKAKKWAQETGKLVCSGSDFHTVEHCARGGIITRERINSNSDLLRVLRSQDFKLIETY